MTREISGLAPLKPFELHTRIAWWDEKWIYMDQRFHAGGRERTGAMVKALLRGPEGNIRPEAILAEMGLTADRPPMPPGVADLNSSRV